VRGNGPAGQPPGAASARRGAGARHGGDGDLLAIAHHVQVDGVPRHQVGDDVGALAAIAHQLAVDVGDDVPGDEPREVGGAVDVDVGDHQAPGRVEAHPRGGGGCQLLGLNPEPAANDAAVLDDV